MLANPSLSSAPLRASLSSRSTAVFAAVAVLALGSTVAATGLGRGAQGRFEEARAAMLAQCLEVSGVSATDDRTGNPCDLSRSGPRAIPEYKLGQQELAALDEAQRNGDHGAAAARLAAVLARAENVDRAHTLVGSVIAGKLIDAARLRVAADPTLLDEPRVIDAIRRTSYASSAHPLESERLHALAVLAHVPAQLPIRSAGLAESTATQAMKDVDQKLRAMELALQSHDLARCEALAEHRDGLAGQVTVGPSICRIAANVVASRERLSALRVRTMLPGPQVHLTTARRL